MRLALTALLLATSLLWGSAVAAPKAGYRLDGSSCGGFPKLPIGTAAGMCAGLVLGPGQGPAQGPGADAPKMPRTLLPLGATGRDWLVTDLGSWTPGQGAVWRLTLSPGGAHARRLLSGLAMPHTVARGPDGRIYVGEMGRIFRFDPDAPDPQATVAAVVTGLPDNRLHADRHPLPAFVFAPDGALLVDVGAPTDACAAPKDRDAQGRCQAIQGAEPQAAIRRYAYLGAGPNGGRWAASSTPLATGLRNSLALALTPKGELLQAENSIDYPDRDRPYEKLDLIKAGGFYGWPYCHGLDTPTDAYAARDPVDCKGLGVVKPVVLMPPHAAPLGMTYYQGVMFPQLQGRLLVAWHGYRATGSQVVAFAVDGRGVPTAKPGAHYLDGGRSVAYAGPGAEPVSLTPAWGPEPGVRPRGAPAGVAVAPDGAIWVADDKNGAIIRLAAVR